MKRTHPFAMWAVLAMSLGPSTLSVAAPATRSLDEFGDISTIEGAT